MNTTAAADTTGSEPVTYDTPRILTPEEIKTVLKGRKRAPLLTKEEIDAMEVPKSFSDRLVSAAKGAFWTPVVVGVGGLLAPLGVVLLATGAWSSRGSGIAAALGNAAGWAACVGSVVLGIGVYGALIFGGPLSLPIIGGALAASSVVGAFIGFRGKVDHKKTSELQAPFLTTHHEANWLASPRRAEQLQASARIQAKWAAEDAERDARKAREEREKAMGAALADAVAKNPERVRSLLASAGIDVPPDNT